MESRTAGGDDWTTLEEVGGQTSQDVGACPGFLGDNPFLEHYLTPFLVDEGDPGDPEDDEYSCDPMARPVTGGRPAASDSTGNRGRSISRTLASTPSTSRSRSRMQAIRSSSSAASRSTTSSSRPVTAARRSRTTATRSTAGSSAMPRKAARRTRTHGRRSPSSNLRHRRRRPCCPAKAHRPRSRASRRSSTS